MRVLAVLALLAAAPIFAAEPDAPPTAKIVPFSETLHSTVISDPYRWMEAGGEDYQTWLRGQADYARDWLDRLPRRAEMLAGIERRSSAAASLREVQLRGDLIFMERREPRAQTARLYARAVAGGPERLLFDPATLDTTEAPNHAINYWEAGPGGRHVYLGVSPGGSERATLRVIDVASGRLLPEQVPLAMFNYSPEVLGGIYPQWLPDGSGFFYNRLREGAVPDTPQFFLNSRLFLHRIGTPVTSDVLIMNSGHDPAVPVVDIAIPFAVAQPGSRYAALLLPEGVARSMPLYLAPLDVALTGHAAWKQVTRMEDQVEGYALAGDRLYLLRRDRPRGHVLLTSAASPSLADAREVVAEGEAVIERIISTADGIYLVERAASGFALRLLRSDGSIVPVPLPFEGASYFLFGSPERRGLVFSLENDVTPRGRFLAEGGAVRDLGIAPAPPFLTDAYLSQTVSITARDGTRVPVTIVRRRDTPRDGKRPVLLDAYGAYGFNADPVFNPRIFALLDAGALYAVAHVRGGGEFGNAWWLAGKGPTKPNTWRDAIDSARWLIDNGWTSRGRIALWGTSAGGIMVGRGVTEEPALWAAGIASVGAMNALRFEFTPNGQTNIPEFGTVADEAGFRALLAMDAYQAIRDGLAYPPMLLTAGANDPRVIAWQPGKFAARLQAATRGGPVLFKVDYGAGHGLGSSSAQLDADAADVAAFTLWAASRADQAAGRAHPTAAASIAVAAPRRR